VHDLDATLRGRSNVDVLATTPTSPNLVDNIFLDPLDAFHAPSSCSLPHPSPECYNISLVNCYHVLEGNVIDCVESLCTFRWYERSLDPYNMYPWSMPVKSKLTMAFDHSKDFCTIIDKFRKALTILSGYMFKFFYSYSYEL